MAKAPAKQEEPAPKAKSSKKFLIIIIAAVLLVVLLGGGVAAFLLMKKKGDAEDGDAEPKKNAAKSAKHQAAPVFVRLEPFTVKLQPDPEKQQEQYLQLVPELRVLDAPVADKIKLYMPEIRHKMLLMLSSKKAAELATPQGVDKLSTDLRNQVNLIVDGEQKTAPPADGKPRAEDSVQSVLFTSFIIQ